ncbi:hypothetical protein INT80_14180 [Gallibacterium anatis]|uniref:Uncharacterized protein n=1 Tax=Gallibacterium anatis TaxID=750 RepID=A0A930UYJ3_9PAST|nr:hypothetical protein [Gallibacterium anatis]
MVGHGEIWSARLVTAYLNQQSIPSVLSMHVILWWQSEPFAKSAGCA